MIGWKPIHEIYRGELITEKDISIDHFVPWSYVAHDELWNLHPTTRSINSSKGKKLLAWEEYFPSFVSMECFAYCGMQESEVIRKEFDKCAKLHLNNDGVKDRLYQRGLSKNDFSNRLESVVKPVYAEAVNSGFGIWE